MRRKQQREVVFVERAGDSSAKWLFWGALLGAGVALLYAPSSGEETRRNLQRKLWKLRAMTEEKLDEITQQFGGARESLHEMLEDEEDDDLEEGSDTQGRYSRSSPPSPREELERRLAEARARRRSPADLEEPLA
ncbi:MAG TPA: YtxH domain-containing protein [Gemmatimonadales bacterium]|jgi:gas vesicle protein|nr:YtxH domain-containing protein [Gemmatimonadales bacterium]HZI75292.1 YtxH domain-containing protein [Gemmatimonadales bacterium]